MSWLFNCTAGKFTVIAICVFIAGRVSAQVVSANQLAKLTASADAFRQSRPIEKVYLQFDKPYYAVGDTIWFKAYLFDGAYFTPSMKSGILYLEVANDSDKLVKRIMLPVVRGQSWGNIYIDPTEISEGGYTIRAYTNWMRNFGETYVFKKSFYFGNTAQNSWLVNTHVSFVAGNNIDTAHIHMRFNQLNKEPLRLTDVSLSVLDGKKLWYKSKAATNLNGGLDIKFGLKRPAKQLTILVNEGAENNGQKLKIPVTVSRPEDVDLQFMPEGGNLVAGLPATVGFKAIGADGKSVMVEGKIYNSRQQIVASFKSVHDGMGAFEIMPQAGEAYTATVALPNKYVKTFNLPAVKNDGTGLKVRLIKNTDSLEIAIMSSKANGGYYLIGQARGVVCYAAVVNLFDHALKRNISTAAFPTGITRFTLLNAAMQPLNERMIFIDHHDNLQMTIKTDRAFYGSRDSVAAHIHISDKAGKPVSGNFSFAVTDDSQVKIDDTVSGNLLSNLLLSSDLKGNIENPGFYFQPNADESVKQQLDNLLLTQGWVGYDWKDLSDPLKPALFPPENEFDITGKVVNVVNKPIAGSRVVLLSNKPPLVLDTITDKAGRFIFKNIVPLDTPAYIVQARNKHGRSFNIDLKVDEFNPPVFAHSDEDIMPWYVNSDSTLMNFVRNNIARKTEQEKKFIGNGRMLKQVVIKSKKIIKDSQNLNGPGNADLVIDEQELEKAGKKTFLQLLQERLKSFREGVYNRVDTSEPWAQIPPTFITDGHGKPAYWYFVNGKPIKLIIDGISVTRVLGGNSTFTLRDFTYYLSSHSAEDIKGIEVMSSTKYASRYVPSEYAMIIHPSDYTFIEVTTRSGHGPAIANTSGVYLYKSLPFSVPKQFYEPKYTIKNAATAPKDYRSTIYWKPNFVTDIHGNAVLSFYTADVKGTYTIILEGRGQNGNVGSVKSKIDIR